MMAAAIVLIMSAAAPGFAQENRAGSQIDAVTGDNQVIIGDQLYEIAPDAVFYARDEQTKISFSRFEEGDWVEFSVNLDGEIDEMWFSSE
jgi:hypothetical protein